MSLDRREFLGTLAVGVAGRSSTLPTFAANAPEADPEARGVLMDIPNCIGCRKCEFACQEAAGFAVPPIETFDDKGVFEQHRRPHPTSYTTINRFEHPPNGQRPVYMKANCLHCLEPACASACLVGALRKQPDGPVTYDAWKCMGCRYCMVACPFGIPAYEYEVALTPQVRKCTFCADRLAKGEVPACVKICPNDALIFGRRAELLALARQRIQAQPDRYVDHIYGEHEAGGTSWLYLSSVPFERIGLLALGSVAPSRLTESVQHGLFKFFLPPFALYGLLGLVMWVTRREAAASAPPLAVGAREDEIHSNGHLPGVELMTGGPAMNREPIHRGRTEEPDTLEVLR